MPGGFADHDVISIILNPALHGFSNITQQYIARDDRRLRLWTERFSVRKALTLNFRMSPIYGETNVKWLCYSSPENLCVFLSALPKANTLSVLYATQFIFPSFLLGAVDISQVSQTLEINSNRDEPISKLINSPVTSDNYDDCRRIKTAMILPQQVLIDIEYNKEENAMLGGVVELMCKMLFSTTPGMRNITLRSARETDVIIETMLQTLGYMNVNQRHPLDVESPRGGEEAWLELETHDFDGMGWINTNVKGIYVIGIEKDDFDATCREKCKVK